MFGMTKTRLFTQIMTEGLITSLCRPLGWTYLRWFSIRSYQPCNGTFSRTRCYCTSIKFFIKRSFLYDIGILIIQCVALFILCGKLFKKEVHQLLYGEMGKKTTHGQHTRKFAIPCNWYGSFTCCILGCHRTLHDWRWCNAACCCPAWNCWNNSFYPRHCPAF